MLLTLRPTGLSSPVYADWLDYTVIEDGRAVGRMCEDRYSPPELRWFWSIIVIIDSRLGIVTNGRTATLDEAKARFRDSWDRVSANKKKQGLVRIV
jgi:hypothetical protein